MIKFLKKSVVAISILSLAGISAIAAGSEKISSNGQNNILTKSVNVNFDENKEVVLGGETFGIKLFTDGIMVIKIDKVESADGASSPAEKAGIQVNDVITYINNEKVTSNEQFGQAITDSNGKNITLTVKRNKKTFNTALTPVCDNQGYYRAGMWIRDSSAGIGTITYYDTGEKYFASLGHGICDSDTGKLLPLSHGDTVKATITSVTKGEEGCAGGLNGYFNNENIGVILNNTSCGLFGSIDDTSDLSNKKVKIAKPEEIKTGKATIISTIDDSGPQTFEIQIQAVSRNCNIDNNKNMIIKVTDKKLLETASGIVQGMSGSPIIQNGKLVGAVTHVFVNKPDTGYAVFARNMLLNYEENKTNLLDAVA